MVQSKKLKCTPSQAHRPGCAKTAIVDSLVRLAFLATSKIGAVQAGFSRNSSFYTLKIIEQTRHKSSICVWAGSARCAMVKMRIAAGFPLGRFRPFETPV
jgi:hypothetical protein